MGFVGELLGKQNGIQWYYIIGLFIFITLFVVMIYRTMNIPKSDILNYKQSILDNENGIAENELTNK
jgi:hypothetical protein